MHRSGHRILVNARPVKEGYEDKSILTQLGVRVPRAVAQIEAKFGAVPNFTKSGEKGSVGGDRF